MIVTDRMVFLHLQKSGGTFLNKMLEHCVPAARRIGYHLPYREVPDEGRHLPVVGTVRSPWAFYVSWFHFQLGLPKPNPLFVIVSDAGVLNFDATIRNLVALGSDEQRLARLEAALPEQYQRGGINLIKADIADLRRWDGGFYSFLYDRLYSGAADPVIVLTEQLRSDIKPVLERLGHLPDACISSFLADAPPFNVSKHGAPAAYYDQALAELVGQRDRIVVERHGYTFGADLS
ncbi:MAG TPA: hypothetical protein VIL42_11240 [Sphingomicrobium sp.]